MSKRLRYLTDAELSARIRATQEEVRTCFELRADASAFGKRDDINRTAKDHRNAQAKLWRLNREQTRRWQEAKKREKT